MNSNIFVVISKQFSIESCRNDFQTNFQIVSIIINYNTSHKSNNYYNRKKVKKFALHAAERKLLLWTTFFFHWEISIEKQNLTHFKVFFCDLNIYSVAYEYLDA